MSRLQIRPAEKSTAKLRLAIFGPSGSGKTMTSLRIAAGLGGRTGVIDTERGSASKYADRYPFDVIDLPDAGITTYLEAITAFAEAGHEVLIIDSISHAWEWLLDHIDRLKASPKYKGNSFAAWSEGTPLQQRLIDAILTYPGHVIATMRSKTEWIIEQDGRGKGAPVRVGTTPRQREGLEYEFDLLLEMSISNTGRVAKDRSGRYQDTVIDKPSEAFGADLAAWLAEGTVTREPVTTRVTAEAPTPRVAPPPTPPTAPATLSAAKAADLARAISATGHEPAAFATRTLGRPITALTDLSTRDAVTVFRALPPDPEPHDPPPPTDRLEPMPRRDHPTPPDDPTPAADAALEPAKDPAEESPAPFTALTELGKRFKAAGLNNQAQLAYATMVAERPIHALLELSAAEAERLLDRTADPDRLALELDAARHEATA